jgi:hypothetical protein
LSLAELWRTAALLPRAALVAAGLDRPARKAGLTLALPGLAVTLAALGCRDADARAGDWLIVPGQRVGLIDPAATEQSLIEAYGDEAVEWGRIELGEGETVPGTILFRADSTRRLEIFWQDTVARASRLARRSPRGADAGHSPLPGAGCRPAQLVGLPGGFR